MVVIEPIDRIIPISYVARLQRQHVLACNLAPLVGTLAAFAVLPWIRPGFVELTLAVTMWTLTVGVGGTVGFHRYFTHRAFQASSWLRCVFAILGSMAGQGPVIAWVSTHRRHHERSDMVGDPHSPHPQSHGGPNALMGLWHAHAGWLWGHPMPNPMHYAPDLLRDQMLVWINRKYYHCVLLGLMIPSIVNGLILGTWWGVLTGLLWVGAVRMFVTTQFVWSINSVCHMLGARRYRTDEHSRNNIWLAIPTFGEAWHNNHHAYPTSAMFGHGWWELDLGWLVICGLRGLGLVWDVRVPRLRAFASDGDAGHLKHQPADQEVISAREI